MCKVSDFMLKLTDRSHPGRVRCNRLVIFSLVRLTRGSAISSNSDWTSSVLEGEVNRSILRLSTSGKEPSLKRWTQKKKKLRFISHVAERASHTEQSYSNRHFTSLQQWSLFAHSPQCVNTDKHHKLHAWKEILMYALSENSKLLCVLNDCTTIVVMAQFLSQGWWGGSFQRGIGMGDGTREEWEADDFKEWMWAGGSKRADCTWREICSRILAAWRSRWKWDFSSQRDISDNSTTLWGRSFC